MYVQSANGQLYWQSANRPGVVAGRWVSKVALATDFVSAALAAKTAKALAAHVTK